MWQVFLFRLVCTRAHVLGTCSVTEGSAFKLSFRISPHLLAVGTWQSQSLELFSQVTGGTNIIFQQDGSCQKQAQKCPF